MDSVKVSILRMLPQRQRTACASQRSMELLEIYKKVHELLSLKRFMKRLSRLENGVYRGLSEKQRK
jgi:hypothetical protein